MNPAEVNAHVKGYEKRKKQEAEEANMQAWLAGAYVRLAVVSAFESSVEYPEAPYGLEQEQHPQMELWQIQKMRVAGFAAKVDQKLKETEGRRN